MAGARALLPAGAFVQRGDSRRPVPRAVWKRVPVGARGQPREPVACSRAVRSAHEGVASGFGGNRVRILVGEGHPLAQVVASGPTSGAAIRCDVVRAEDLLHQALTDAADAVVVDAAIPLDRLLAALVPVGVTTRTLVLCLHPLSEPPGSQAIVATACAFFLASADAAEVAHVVTTEHARRCGHTQPAPAAGLAAATTAPSSTLSAREKFVLTLLAQEKTSKEIAGVLGISARTVDATRSSLMRKLRVQSTVGLACYAVGAGLVGP